VRVPGRESMLWELIAMILGIYLPWIQPDKHRSSVLADCISNKHFGERRLPSMLRSHNQNSGTPRKAVLGKLPLFFEGEVKIGIGDHRRFAGSIGNGRGAPDRESSSVICKYGSLGTNKVIDLFGDQLCSKYFCRSGQQLQRSSKPIMRCTWI